MKCLRYIFLFGMVLLLFSCKKFKGGQEIPAYVKIEPWTLTTNYDIEGAATHAITDAWIYVDGSLHGCFEMKSHSDGTYVMIPLLKEGGHKLQIYPGVKLNGIASTRVQYPFYQPYVVNYDFKQGETGTFTPSTKYYDINVNTSICFKMMEDFEDIMNIRLYSTDTTYADLEPIDYNTDPNAWLDPVNSEHCKSGHIHLGDDTKRFCVASDTLQGIPSVGNYVLLEMDYKCSSEMLVGLYLKSSQEGIIDKEMVYLKASNTWKKTYINFSPIFNENPNIAYAKFYLKGVVEGTNTADFYIDNIKLIYR